MTDPPTPDPRDRRDDGLQDARDDSDPGSSIGHQSYRPEEDYDDEPDDWRDRYDTREEYEDR